MAPQSQRRSACPGSARSGAKGEQEARSDHEVRRTLDNLVSAPSGVTMKATSLKPKLDAEAQTMTKCANPPALA